MRYLSFFILAVIPTLFMSFSSGQNGDGVKACTKEYNPVCALTQVQCITAPCDPVQQTYGNICVMESEGAQFLYKGECVDESAEDPIMCTMQYDPVCGVDGVTYGNACSAGKRPIAYPGECALPDMSYCAAYYDGCNNCSVGEDGLAACTLMYCETPGTPRCTAFVDTVGAGDITIFDAAKKQWLSDIFTKVTATRNELDTADQIKYYSALATAFDTKVKEWKDFAMVASFTPEGYAQFQKKIVYYAYLHFLVVEKLTTFK